MEQPSTSTRMACCGVRLRLDMPLVFCLVRTGIYIGFILTLLFSECRDPFGYATSLLFGKQRDIYFGYVLSLLFGKCRDIH